MSLENSDQLLRWGAEQLDQAGIEDGLLQARRLLAFALFADSYETSALLNSQPDKQDAAKFKTLIASRVQRIPLQHIVGETGFMRLVLKTDARALIPRDDTSEVVLLAMDKLGGEKDRNWKIADLGTGSGAILSALLDDLPNAHGIAVEQSAAAMSLAEENFETLGFLPRIALFKDSWENWAGWNECDLIVSNPPYIESAVLSTLQPEVREHDPVDALDGGVDGLDAYRQIIGLAETSMRPGAWLVLEIGHDQKEAVTKLLEGANFAAITHARDLGGNDRAIAARKV
ncbi:MAG: peptide chain release factor N(5)-glutamine methyltransferase [Henriciella sp.]